MTRSELPFTFLEDGPIFNLYGNSGIGAYIGEIMERDYAAFIVKACNAHDELVEALKEIRDGCADTGTFPGKRMTKITKQDAFQIACAALAKVQP